MAVEKINKNLTKKQEEILFNESTEAPGSSALNYDSTACFPNSLKHY